MKKRICSPNLRSCPSYTVDTRYIRRVCFVPSPYIFSKFNPGYTNTFYAPPGSVSTGFDCISIMSSVTPNRRLTPTPYIKPHYRILLFRERLSEKVHATIPKGIVSGFGLRRPPLPPSLSKGMDDRARPPYLKVCIRHCERPWTYVCEC